MRAILVRHGETPWNREGRFQGQDEVGLSRRGVAQSRRVAKALASMRPTALYSSPLARTMETACELSRQLSLPIIQVEELQEVNLGELEGITNQEMQARYPQIHALWRHDPSQVLFPGGESLPKLQERAWRAIEEIERSHSDDVVIVVSHNFAIRTIVFRLLDIPLSKFHIMRPDLSSISIIEFRDGTWRLVSFNERLHLPRDKRVS